MTQSNDNTKRRRCRIFRRKNKELSEGVARSPARSSVPKRRRKKKDVSIVKELPDIKVQVAFGAHVRSNKIKRKQMSIKKLFSYFKTPEIRDDKFGKYIVFASFKKSIRNAQNLEKYYGATIDIDDTGLALSEVRSIFSKFTNCIYSTFSHMLTVKDKQGAEVYKGNRYRVIIPYTQPLLPQDHMNILLYLFSLIGPGQGLDITTTTLSIPAHLPATSADRVDEFVSVINSAELLNPYDTKIQAEIPLLMFERAANQDEPEALDISKEIIEGERNSTLTRIAGKFLRNGVKSSDLFDMVNAINETKCTNPAPASEVKIICNSVVNSQKKNTGDLDWGFEEILSRINNSSDVKAEFEHLAKMIAHAQLKRNITSAEFEMCRNDLSKKSSVTKVVCNAEISKASMELQGKDETANEEMVEANQVGLREKFRDWVYVAAEDKVYNTDSGLRLTREAFNVKYIDKDMKGGVFGILAKYGIINKVSKAEFNPEEDIIYSRERITYVNTYVAPQIDIMRVKIKAVQPMLAHFRYLLPNIRERRIMLDFIAHLIQFPGKKIRWMLILKGGKGIGKTVLAETLIYHMIGGITNWGKVSNSLIKSDFNSWQLDKQLLVFEELDTGSGFKEKEALTNKLKEFITDNFLKAHKKGLDAYDTINKACCMGFTNVDQCVIITPDERRFCMVKSNARPKNTEYYERLVKFFDSNISLLYSYFMKRDLTDFSYSTAPDTKYTREIKTLSMPYPGGVIQDIIENKFPQFTHVGALTASMIVEICVVEARGKYISLASELSSRNSTMNKQMYSIMKSLGFTQYIKPGARDNRYNVRGFKQTIWRIPGRPHEKNILKQSHLSIVRALNTTKIEQQPEVITELEVIEDE